MHILDWFHIAMRLTVLGQMGKSVEAEHTGEKFEEELERVKWFLWHSNVYKALQLLEWLALDRFLADRYQKYREWGNFSLLRLKPAPAGSAP